MTSNNTTFIKGFVYYFKIILDDNYGFIPLELGLLMCTCISYAVVMHVVLIFIAHYIQLTISTYTHELEQGHTMTVMTSYR